MSLGDEELLQDAWSKTVVSETRTLVEEVVKTGDEAIALNGMILDPGLLVCLSFAHFDCYSNPGHYDKLYSVGEKGNREQIPTIELSTKESPTGT